MPVSQISNISRKGKPRPFQVDVRTIYPEKFGDSSKSLDVVLEYFDRDPNTKVIGWQEIDRYSSLSTSRKAAEDFIGRTINDEEWEEEQK